MAVPPPRSTQPLERAATWLSLACAAHCLIVPVAVTVMPLLGASFASNLSEGVEHALTGLVVASALGGVFWGYRRHRDLKVVLATAAGLVVYLIGHVLEGSITGLTLGVLGALVLASSSFLSARLQHAADDPHCAH